jgi:hypothetical protein
MGTKIKPLRLAVILLLIAQTMFAIGDQKTNTPDKKITERYLERARSQLKAYGFARCILFAEQYAKKPNAQTGAIYDDIIKTSSFYHFMNRGVHILYQNYDTLKVLWDPYIEMDKYIERHYPFFHRRHVPFTSACLDMYNSKMFNAFVNSQDWLIQLDDIPWKEE